MAIRATGIKKEQENSLAVPLSFIKNLINSIQKPIEQSVYQNQGAYHLLLWYKNTILD